MLEKGNAKSLKLLAHLICSTPEEQSSMETTRAVECDVPMTDYSSLLSCRMRAALEVATLLDFALQDAFSIDDN